MKGMKEKHVENKEIEKTCCFYVSDFHLEMILMPYINDKIEENITILSEKNLRDTLEIVTSKMNINEEKKQKILQLKWEGEEPKENSNIIVIGSKDYILQKNADIQNINPISVLDCYNFEEEKDNMNNLIKRYKNTINTLGNNNF